MSRPRKNDLQDTFLRGAAGAALGTLLGSQLTKNSTQGAWLGGSVGAMIGVLLGDNSNENTPLPLEESIRLRLIGAECNGTTAFIEWRNPLSIRVLFKYNAGSYWDITATAPPPISRYPSRVELEDTLYDDFAKQFEKFLQQIKESSPEKVTS